jgi:hypothetical protein
MNTYLKLLFSCALLLLCGRASSAQQVSSAGGLGCQVVGYTTSSAALRRLAITGEPYSALQESAGFQTLADGTHIDRKIGNVRMYRDSDGRTRTENFTSANPESGRPEVLTSITINDPVAELSYLLDPGTRVARQFVPPTSSTANGSKGGVRPMGAPASPNAAPAGGLAGTTSAPALVKPPELLRPKSSSEDLGTQEMEGLQVRGWRTTTTFPTGSQGNDRPITSVRETWCSQELRVNILTKTSDPRSGEFTTQLTNIDRTEPDPALFQVPADYTITQQ